MDDHRWAELERVGWTHRQANRGLADKSLRRIRHGSYGDPTWSDAVGEHRRLIESTWPILKRGAVLSHYSAAVLLGLPVPKQSLDRVWITRPGSSGKTTRWLHLVRADLTEADVIMVDDLPVTTAARTAVDLGRRLDLLDGLPVFDAALRAGQDRRTLAEMADLGSGRRGDRMLSRLIELADPRAESVGESRSRALMWMLKLPMPVLQVEVYDEQGFVGRVDFDWPEHSCMGEFDGLVKYARELDPDENPVDRLVEEKLREDRIRRCRRVTVERWIWSDLFRHRRFDQRLRHALGIS